MISLSPSKQVLLLYLYIGHDRSIPHQLQFTVFSLLSCKIGRCVPIVFTVESEVKYAKMILGLCSLVSSYFI
jgi:hypothetical protein